MFAVDESLCKEFRERRALEVQLVWASCQCVISVCGCGVSIENICTLVLHDGYNCAGLTCHVAMSSCQESSVHVAKPHTHAAQGGQKSLLAAGRYLGSLSRDVAKLPS